MITRASEETVSPRVRDKGLPALVKALRPSDDAVDAIRHVLDEENPPETDTRQGGRGGPG
ncbi:hypothetical protein [Amycolatopsis sp. NPDC059021]|uniref:hypothetical protein n=1 Tax=Amycolatopsis sp. NPDC059021 TaxID=3346704 RepID=UPI0036707C44